ncbi:hypothetical protein [Nocardia brasiliensis]|nr:hypothetical protein [Nocardia brasiliensis]
MRSLVEPPRPRLRHYLYAVRLVAGASSKTALWPHPVHGYSGLRSLEWAEVPTNTLRSLAGPHGGSTNDAYLSSLARVISQWAARHHPNSDGHEIPISLAINNRRPADVSAPGNQFAVGRMTLPGDNVPFAQGTRMTAVRTAPLKQGQYREAIRRLAASVPRLVMERAFRSALSPARACVLSSHFVIRRPLAFAGDPVHAIDPVTALPVGAPVSILLITYQKVSRAVFVTDSIVPGLENLHEMWHAEVSAGR